MINDLVDDSGFEDLLCLVCEQEQKIVHHIQLCGILKVLAAPLWKQLLSKEVNEALEIRATSQFGVLLCMLEAELDSIEDWAAH